MTRAKRRSSAAAKKEATRKLRVFAKFRETSRHGAAALYVGMLTGNVTQTKRICGHLFCR